MSNLPTSEQIQNFSDEKLLSIIKSGDAINWNIRFDGEDQSDVDDYMSELFIEKEKRNL